MPAERPLMGTHVPPHNSFVTLSVHYRRVIVQARKRHIAGTLARRSRGPSDCVSCRILPVLSKGG